MYPSRIASRRKETLLIRDTMRQNHTYQIIYGVELWDMNTW